MATKKLCEIIQGEEDYIAQELTTFLEDELSSDQYNIISITQSSCSRLYEQSEIVTVTVIIIYEEIS